MGGGGAIATPKGRPRLNLIALLKLRDSFNSCIHSFPLQKLQGLRPLLSMCHIRDLNPHHLYLDLMHCLLLHGKGNYSPVGRVVNPGGST